MQGRQTRDEWFLDVLASVQANLISVHLPKGKSVRAKQFRRGERARGIIERTRRAASAREAKREAATAPPSFVPVKEGDKEAARHNLRERARLLRERDEEKETMEFWESPEGRRIQEELEETEELDREG